MLNILTDAARRRRRQAIGRQLVALRSGEGGHGETMNQTEFGIRLGENHPTGSVPQTTISRWERGTVDLTLEDALSIEVTLGITYGTLARAGGYIAPDEGASASIEEALRTDPNIDPELREDVITIYRSYKKMSARANRDDRIRSSNNPKRRVNA